MLLIRIYGGKVFVQPVAEEADVCVDFPEDEVKPGETAYGIPYDALVKFGDGRMYFDADGNPTAKRPPMLDRKA